jgi:hypothetical protein
MAQKTRLINQFTRDENSWVGSSATVITVTIQPQNNEFDIEPYEIYQQYDGDFTSAKRALIRNLKKQGFKVIEQ